MEFIDSRSIHDFLSNTKIFAGRKITVHSIYNNHSEEKCFHIKAYPGPSDYKVRFATETSKRSAGIEYEAFKILRQNNIDWVPQVYEYQSINPAYLISDYRDGCSLDKGGMWIPSAPRILNGLISTLNDLHKIEGSYFGHLGGPHHKSWQAFLDTRFWGHVQNVYDANMINSADLGKIRLVYEDSCPLFADIRPTFLHADVKPANIVYDSERGNVALVDFELARFGDIELEWVKAFFLSKRWPEYSSLISGPLLAGVGFEYLKVAEKSPQILVYSLYHIFSILAFEYKKKLPIPDYRFDELNEILGVIHEHY